MLQGTFYSVWRKTDSSIGWKHYPCYTTSEWTGRNKSCGSGMLVLCCTSISQVIAECKNYSVMNNSCNCHKHTMQEPNTGAPLLKAKKSISVLPSVILSIFIAFFPKCPVCWA